jgi:hypothetical protein
MMMVNHFNSSVTMNAAAPDRAPPRRISDKKIKTPRPPFLGEALMRDHSYIVFMILVRTCRFMPVSPEQ